MFDTKRWNTSQHPEPQGLESDSFSDPGNPPPVTVTLSLPQLDEATAATEVQQNSPKTPQDERRGTLGAATGSLI